jgi:hypothetical protein
MIQRFYFNFRIFLDSFFKELILIILEVFKQTLLKMFTTSKEEDKTINNIWKEQRVRLLSPLNSLSFHLADETQEDKLTNWQEVWKENLI